jgi:hypothetical protein
MKNEKFCSQLSKYFKRHVGFRSKRTFRLSYAAAGEIETTQENIQNWLDEGDPGFQLLAKEEIADVIFFIYLHQQYLY